MSVVLGANGKRANAQRISSEKCTPIIKCTIDLVFSKRTYLHHHPSEMHTRRNAAKAPSSSFERSQSCTNNAPTDVFQNALIYWTPNRSRSDVNVEPASYEIPFVILSFPSAFNPQCSWPVPGLHSSTTKLSRTTSVLVATVWIVIYRCKTIPITLRLFSAIVVWN